MSKRSDVAWGRRGGRAVPDGVRPGEAINDIAEIRAEAIEAGTWPSDEDADDNGQGSLW